MLTERMHHGGALLPVGENIAGGLPVQSQRGTVCQTSIKCVGHNHHISCEIDIREAMPEIDDARGVCLEVDVNRLLPNDEFALLERKAIAGIGSSDVAAGIVGERLRIVVIVREVWMGLSFDVLQVDKARKGHD